MRIIKMLLVGMAMFGMDPIYRFKGLNRKPTLAQHMEKISRLPKTKQRFVMEMLDTLLAQQGR